ncbi:hypothetical protein KKF61_05930 [Patescibacteria group bacterium]|nr:hypothetical protein [Patescibacteria group bacterium]MBU0964603.1 hypothetical protein [Patescibacteria group bacterium]
MLLLSHTLTGAVIGQKIDSQAIIIPLALISHFILDHIPHWNYDVPDKYDGWTFLKTLPDIISSAIVYLTFIFIFPDQWLNITLGVGFAILPDLITLSKYISGLKKIFYYFNWLHTKVQADIEKGYKRTVGLFIQTIYIGLIIITFLLL